jgi:hypothetical protein
MYIRFVVIISILLLCVAMLPATPVRGATNIRYVDVNTGYDWMNNCTDPLAPCRTIQRAVNQASQGDTIKVATGIYTREVTLDPCSQFWGGYPTVVCIINKDLTLIGGYPSGNWSSRNPAAHPTIIDGEWQYRGVWVQDTERRNPPTAGITMDGFIVRRGRVRGQPSGSDPDTFAFGGGLLADFARVTLRNMRFENNVAAGGGESNPYGGNAAGAAVAIRKSDAVQLERIVFFQNWSKGGSGTERGGYAMGAGLFLFRTRTIASMLELYENASDAGDTSGNGMFNGETADAFGAITVMGYADVQLWNVIARGNRVRGGNAAIRAGGGFGGAIMAEGFPTTDEDGDGQYESVTLRINGCELTDNRSEGGDATGGSGTYGGYGAGGAISTIHSTVFISRCKILRNVAQGGNGSWQGPAGGGGLHFHNISHITPTVYVDNSLIARNTANAGSGNIVGGGGGGVWLQGITASLMHNTIAENCLNYPLLGSAIIVLSYGAPMPRPAYIHYNIIANHISDCDPNPNSGALFVHNNNSAHLNRNLFFNNKLDKSFFGSGVIYGFGTSVLANPSFVGGSQAEHAFRITASSGAINQATYSSIRWDIEGNPRLHTPDIGAYEHVRKSFLSIVRR